MRARWNTLAISGTGQAAQLASHSPVIARAVPERLNRVVNGRYGRQVEYDHRHLGAAHDRQHGRRQGVRGDVQEDQVHIGPPEAMPGLDGLGGCVDQAEVDDLDAGRLQLARRAADSPPDAPSSRRTAASTCPDRCQTIRCATVDVSIRQGYIIAVLPKSREITLTAYRRVFVEMPFGDHRAIHGAFSSKELLRRQAYRIRNPALGR